MSMFGPICGAISQIVPGDWKLGWAIPAGVLIVGMTAYALQRSRQKNSQQVIH
jgi:hypothetical protein